MTAVAILQANGAKNEDGSRVTLRSFLGREPVTLVDEAPLTDAQREEREREKEERAEKIARAQAQMFEANLRRQAAQGRGPEIVG